MGSKRGSMMLPSGFTYEPYVQAQTKLDISSHASKKRAGDQDEEEVSDDILHDNDHHQAPGFEQRDSLSDSRYWSIISDGTSIHTFHTTKSRQTAGSRESAASNFSKKTPWQKTLDEKNLLLPKFDETNWSDRGQHVEFGPGESARIEEMLTPKGVLGHSSTALVEKVRCKRIMLARKKVRCNWRLKREEAIEEVAHLQRLSHAHVIRCVGTYVFGKDLAILLYPATAYNLETFLDHCADLDSRIKLSMADGKMLHHMRTSILKFFKCLASTIQYLHSCLVKHMDIKPTNILIQEKHDNHGLDFKLYIADFGIARSYTTLTDVETESLTMFTKIYAAPEVVLQAKRGLPADVFSLGCVFLEMMGVLARKKDDLIEIRKANPEGDMSYQANLVALRQDQTLTQWAYVYSLQHTGVVDSDGHFLHAVYSNTLQMMDHDPDLRPQAPELWGRLTVIYHHAPCCSKRPEPFEAEPLMMNVLEG